MPAFSAGPPFLHRVDRCSLGLAQTEGLGQFLGHLLDDDADATPADLAAGAQLRLHLHRDIDRNGKGDAHEATRTAVDLRVDADHLALHVEQRAARIAGIDGDIGLDEGHVVLLRQRARPLALTMPAVTLLSKPNGEPIATTHSPTLRTPGSPKRTVGRAGGLDLDQRDIGSLVGTDDPRLELTLVGQTNQNLVSPSITCALVRI
jgi:hypothetical protein